MWSQSAISLNLAAYCSAASGLTESLVPSSSAGDRDLEIDIWTFYSSAVDAYQGRTKTTSECWYNATEDSTISCGDMVTWDDFG